jgi:hypothetical protein
LATSPIKRLSAIKATISSQPPFQFLPHAVYVNGYATGLGFTPRQHNFSSVSHDSIFKQALDTLTKQYTHSRTSHIRLERGFDRIAHIAQFRARSQKI